MTETVAANTAFAAEKLFGSLAALTVFEATTALVHADGREDDLIVLRHPGERLTGLVGLEPLPRLAGVVASFLSLHCIRLARGDEYKGQGGKSYCGLHGLHTSFLCLRAYQRLATSWVIAIPHLDWSSFGLPRRSWGLSGHSLASLRQ